MYKKLLAKTHVISNQLNYKNENQQWSCIKTLSLSLSLYIYIYARMYEWMYGCTKKYTLKKAKPKTTNILIHKNIQFKIWIY